MTESPALISPEARPRKSKKQPNTKHRPLPTKQELCKWFRYDPHTGILYRIAEMHKRSFDRLPLLVERAVGHALPRGHLMCRVPGMKNDALVSRVAWVIQTGQDPADKEVDHINLDKKDNKWCNLRLATKAENTCNRTKNSAAAGKKLHSKYKGVTRDVRKDGKRRPKIYAKITVNGRRIYLGTFPTEEAAHAAYCEAAKKYHGEFARTE